MKVIRGFKSYHSNRYEDRVWQAHECQISECKITSVKFTEKIPVKLDGIEIVGVQTFQSCNPDVNYEAQFSKSKTLTETSSIEESTEESFTSSTTVSVSAEFTVGKEGVASQTLS